METGFKHKKSHSKVHFLVLWLITVLQLCLISNISSTLLIHPKSIHLFIHSSSWALLQLHSLSVLKGGREAERDRKREREKETLSFSNHIALISLSLLPPGDKLVKTNLIFS